MRFDNDSSMNKTLLASTSPRRHQMLATLIPHLEVGCIPHVNESTPHLGDVFAIAQDLAHQKLQAVLMNAQSEAFRFIVTADTLVAHGEQILGKPRDIQAARQMLLSHLGKTHTVVSAAWLYDRQTQTEHPLLEAARVFFKPHSPTIEALIEDYLTLSPPLGPLDKAGAYGIQEALIGENLIDHIDGSYEAIVGFPLKRFSNTLSIILNKIQNSRKLSDEIGEEL